MVRFLLHQTLVIRHLISSKVQLGDKEWIDSEQPVNREPFPVTNLPVYFIDSENTGVKVELLQLKVS